MDNNGLHCLNDPGNPTWFGSWKGNQPSVLDLTLINEAMVFSRQLGELTISYSESLGSDHAALLLDYYLSEGVTLTALRAPAGYCMDDNRRDAWIKAFSLQYITSNNATVLSVPWELSGIPCLQQVESEHSDHDTPC